MIATSLFVVLENQQRKERTFDLFKCELNYYFIIALPLSKLVPNL